LTRPEAYRIIHQCGFVWPSSLAPKIDILPLTSIICLLTEFSSKVSKNLRTFFLRKMSISYFLWRINMKTFMASPATIDRKWYVVDATGMTLGRLASEVAKVLRGKNKPIFTPHIDTGDYVIVINAEKVAVTGKKLDQKIYYHHSDYVGGMKETTLREKLAKKPEEVVELAVKGMLPKGPLGREMYKKLFVYAGPEHKHAAQKPEVLTF